MKLFKPLLTVLALAFALIFITACSSGGNAGSSSGKTTAKARTIDEIKKSGELRIAVFGDKKPFGYVDNDGSYQALLDGRGDAFSTDNTEVLVWALENKGFEVGITSLGDPDTIAAAVQKGNQELLDFINKDIEKLGKENFFHKAYEKTLHLTYGDAAKADDLVVEGGKVD